MFAHERQEAIVLQVNGEGSVLVKELSKLYAVTEDCIRKDLSLLEKQGLLKKTYGGAVCIKKNPHLYKSEDRKTTPNKERVLIAKKAMALIQDQETIFLDVSLTSIEIAKLLVQSSLSVTVVTNMIDVLTLLTPSSLPVIFIGGQLNQERDGFWGGLSQYLLQTLRIDKAFLGVVGIDSVMGQVTTYHADDGMLKKIAIQQSQSHYLLCEERKLKEYGNFVFAALNEFTGIIIAESLSAQMLDNLQRFEIDIL